MDVMTVVVKDGRGRSNEASASRVSSVEIELAGDAAHGFLGLAVEIDPEQPRAAQPSRAVGEAVELLDPVPVEQHDLARHTAFLGHVAS